MVPSTIEIEKKDSAAAVWLNRPAVHNAFDDVLIQEQTGAPISLDKERDLRAIVIAGWGKSSSAGADLNWMQRQGQASMQENLDDARRLAELFRVLSECGKPTIGRVHGAEMGGGIGGGIGECQAYWYAQKDDRTPATRACELGLIHDLVVPNHLDEAVRKLIDALVLGGFKARAALTALIRAVSNQPSTSELIKECARRFAMLRATDQAREGLTAFPEKRRRIGGLVSYVH